MIQLIATRSVSFCFFHNVTTTSESPSGSGSAAVIHAVTVGDPLKPPLTEFMPLWITLFR